MPLESEPSEQFGNGRDGLPVRDDRPVDEFEGLGVEVHYVSGGGEDLLANLGACRADRIPDVVGGAARGHRAVEGRERRVGRRNHDGLDRASDGVGGHLGEHRCLPRANLGSGDQHRHPAVVFDLDDAVRTGGCRRWFDHGGDALAAAQMRRRLAIDIAPADLGAGALQSLPQTYAVHYLFVDVRVAFVVRIADSEGDGVDPETGSDHVHL